MSRIALKEHLEEFTDYIAEFMEDYIEEYEEREDFNKRIDMQLHDFRSKIAVEMDAIRGRMGRHG